MKLIGDSTKAYGKLGELWCEFLQLNGYWGQHANENIPGASERPPEQGHLGAFLRGLQTPMIKFFDLSRHAPPRA